MKSLSIITIVKPAGPIFFWAPAYINENLLTSRGSLKITEDASEIIGLFTLGASWIATPWIVSFGQ